MRPRLLIAALLVLGGLAVAVAATGSPGTVNGRIAYERHGFHYDPSEVWTMNQDGSAPRRVAAGLEPSWSADGARLVMVSERGEIVLIDEDGTDAHAVEIDGGSGSDVTSPALSPDGATIAYGRRDGLYVVSAGGGVAQRIAPTFNPAPSWSPDGARIAFAGPNGRLELIRPDGSGIDAIPGVFVHWGHRSSWSPDGSRIAFVDSVAGGISTVSLDGTNRRVLTGWARGFFGPSDVAWSPDGARIAFVHSLSDICVMNADGTGLGRLTYAPSEESTGRESRNVSPAWQPLPAGSPPGGAPVAHAGPPPSWDRSQSWAPACSRQTEQPILTADRASARTHVGGVVTYRLRLENRSEVPIGERGTAGFVVAPLGGLRILSLTGTRDACEGTTCRFGAVFPGEHVDAVLRVQARVAGEIEIVFRVPYRYDVDEAAYDLTVSTRADRCTIRGTRRADALSGSARGDVLCGLEGNDRLRPGGGRDIVHAGPGNDVVDVRGGGRDDVVCGDGTDTVAADRNDRVAPDCERRTR